MRPLLLLALAAAAAAPPGLTAAALLQSRCRHNAILQVQSFRRHCLSAPDTAVEKRLVSLLNACIARCRTVVLDKQLARVWGIVTNELTSVNRTCSRAARARRGIHVS